MTTKFIRGGKPFTPSGANYIRFTGGSVSTFSRGLYDTTALEAALTALAARGYNTVRLTYWSVDAGNPFGAGIDPIVADNVADGILRAHSHGLAVVLSTGGIPVNGGYLPATPGDYDSFFDGSWAFSSTDAYNARDAYYNDLLFSLISRGITADMLLMIELAGEIAFSLTTWPLKLTSGTVAVREGTYDMAIPARRQAFMDDAIVGWINLGVTRTRIAFPTIGGTDYPLAEVQLLPAASNLTPALAATPNAAVINRSHIEALILTLYPTYDVPLPTIMASLPPLPASKPVMMETGWMEAHTGTLATKAEESVQWIAAACGYGVYGFLWFEYDNPISETFGLLPMTSGGNVFLDALAPPIIGDGCGNANPFLTPILATNKAIAHFYAPGKYANNADAPIHVSEKLLSARVVMEQVNKFDSHHLEFALLDKDILLALAPFTTVDIEQVGVGIIGRAIITAPDKQVDASFVDKVVIDAPNIVEQAAEINTGLGYIDAQAISAVVQNLGQLGTKGISELVFDATSPFGYFPTGLAHTHFTPGREDGWTGVFIDDGSMINSSSPVLWDYVAKMNVNGNTVTRTAGSGFGYTNDPNLWCGAVGSPIHTDITQPCNFSWQIVIPTTLQVGLRNDLTIGSPTWGFDFSPLPVTPGQPLQGTWAIIHNGSGIGRTGTFDGNTRFAVSIIYGFGAAFAQYWVNGLPQGGLSHGLYGLLQGGGPFRPSCFVSSADGEVDNAIFSRTVPTSQAWYQVAYNKLTKPEALIKLAKDTGLFVRLGQDINGAPERIFELGPMNALPTVTLVDSSGGDISLLRANPYVRVIKSIDSNKRDVSGVYTVSTPLGSGTGSAQVTIELLWRILYDPSFQDSIDVYGEDVTRIFPEYNHDFKIYRTPTLSQGYEYFIVYEPAFAPIGFKAWLLGGTLAADSFGYKEGGLGADSTFVYPDQATVGQREATQRFLYAAWVEKMKRAVEPHVTLSLTCLGDWRPPRAGDKVRIDYTKIQTDEQTGLGFSTTYIKTGIDQFGNLLPNSDSNRDPRIMSVTRQFDGDKVPEDVYVLSNLGKYEDDGSEAQDSMETQVAALQVVQQNNTEVSHFGPAFSEADTAHPIDLPFYFLPTTFRVSAFYLYVTYGPFRQPISSATTDFYNAGDTPIFVTTSSQDIPLPSLDWSTQNANIGGIPKHVHRTKVHLDNEAIVIPSVPYSAVQKGYVHINENSGFLYANTFETFIFTDGGADDIIDIELDPTKHPHIVAKHGDVFIHIPANTALATLPQHIHPLPPGIKDLETPVGFSIFVDSGDGVFFDRTGSLVDVNSGAGPDPTNGFQSGVLLELSRFMNKPGRTCNIRLVPHGDGTNGGRARLGWSGTIMEEVGGLGSIIKAQA